MLNISSRSGELPEAYRHYQQAPYTVWARVQVLFRRWLIISLILFVAICFLPWTQNVQATGRLTTLLPQDRPQSINSYIAGQLVEWRVREGQAVAQGDTLARLSEIKPEYLDPMLVERTRAQADAKEAGASFYLQKADALDELAANLLEQQELKQEQLNAKEAQTLAYISTQEAAIENARQQLQIAEIQLARTDSLFSLGNRSRAELEEKRRKAESERAKLVKEQNRLTELSNELDIVRLERSATRRDYNGKINKARSDRFAALSSYQASLGDQQKLEVQAESYTRRSAFYYVIAPQDGIISEILVRGLGEAVKEGDALLTIVPSDIELAVELFVRPVDLPLLRMGQEVRFVFDGWPAIVFSGWPDYSFGTFFGHIVGIDNTTNAQGEYRILVAPDPERPWPEPLRPGSGARGIALLNNVPVWYEIWRQLNAFPPEYYQAKPEEKDKAGKIEKAPVRSVIK